MTETTAESSPTELEMVAEQHDEANLPVLA